MPDDYTKRLRTLVSGYPNISLIAVKDFREFFEKTHSYNYGDSFATVRLDDDDGLNKSYVDRLQRYSENIGSIVSFTEVRKVKYAGGNVVIGKNLSARNIALGLAGIGCDVYDCGRHSDINTRYNVIYDASPDMLFLNCSPFADTRRGFTTWDRIVVKFKRICFLLWNRPMEVPRELGAPLRKVLRR